MAVIGIVLRPGVQAAVNLAKQIRDWAATNGHTVLSEPYTGKLVGIDQTVDYPELARRADPIITLGGDGTLIRVARYVNGSSPVMLGVNFGTLGFLTEISPSETFEVLEGVLAGTVHVGERIMLTAAVVRAGKEIFSSPAVNDAVVQKGTRDKILGLDLFVDDKEIVFIRADGLIVATPTGSTAYSLAAGGAIVHPEVQVVLVTPICPHSLTNRPLVLSLDSEVKIVVPEYEGEVFLSVDGQESCQLFDGDIVTFRKANEIVRFVRSPNRSYFDILRTKLNWGIANKSE